MAGLNCPSWNAVQSGRPIVGSATSCRLNSLAVVIGYVYDIGHVFLLLLHEPFRGRFFQMRMCGRASFLHLRQKPRESDPCLLAEILIVFPPSALALADVCVILDELDGANVLDHCETELCLDPQAERGTVIDWER